MVYCTSALPILAIALVQLSHISLHCANFVLQYHFVKKAAYGCERQLEVHDYLL